MARPKPTIADYDDQSADQVVQRLRKLSQTDLTKLEDYERQGQARRTVLEAIASLRGAETRRHVGAGWPCEARGPAARTLESHRDQRRAAIVANGLEDEVSFSLHPPIERRHGRRFFRSGAAFAVKRPVRRSACD